LVVFRDAPALPPPAAPEVRIDCDPTDDRRLVEELSQARDELQAALTEAQSSKEDLKASHEEMTSINEELQSTNEELETSKEELQSLNEELVTLNAQLQAKMAELESTSSDLESLLASTDIAVLFLDPSLRIRRFTPATRALLDLIAGDVGRPVAALAWRFDDPRLEEDCRAVLERLLPIEREVAGANKRCYLRRVLPYRTIDNRIDGVVVTFFDVTVSRRAEEIIRASEERMRLILASATDYAVFTLDARRNVTGWSPGAEAVFGYSENEMIGRLGDVLFTPDDQTAGEPEREASSAQETGRAADERWYVRKDGTRFFANGVLTQLGVGGPSGFVKVLRNLTDRKQMEDELRAARDELGMRVSERTADLAKTVKALETEIGRRRELSRQLVQASEAERRRVSRDLHDTASQILAGLSLAAGALQREAGLSPAGKEKAEEVSLLAESLSKELHVVAVRLRPTALDDVGLATALTELVQNWSNRTGVGAEIGVIGIDQERLPAEVETVIYRVVQEALTNIAKHAGATKVSVLVNRLGTEAQVAVEDDGHGFDRGATESRRLGLAGMRERVEVVGGTLEIETTAGSGTTILARIPLA